MNKFKTIVGPKLSKFLWGKEKGNKQINKNRNNIYLKKKGRSFAVSSCQCHWQDNN